MITSNNEDLPLFGQDIIIKVTRSSGEVQWWHREHVYPLLSDTVVKRVSGFKYGNEWASIIELNIYGPA
jgi:hypothetical protein